MKRYEKVLGLFIALLCVVGAVAVIARHDAFGLLSIIGVVGFVVLLAVQSLRELRRQKRSAELLREYLTMTRADLSGRLGAVGLEAKSDRGDLVSYLATVESRLLDSMKHESNSLHDSQNKMAQKLIAQQDGLRAVVENLDSELKRLRVGLDAGVADIDMKLSEEARHLAENVADAKARTMEALEETRRGLDEAIAVNVQDVRIDQRVISNRMISLQDVLREMLSGVRKTQERQHGMLETLSTVLEGQGGRIDDMAAGTTLAGFESVVSDLHDELIASQANLDSRYQYLLAEMGRINEIERGSRSTLQTHFDERLDSEFGALLDLLESTNRATSRMEYGIFSSASGGRLNEISRDIAEQKILLKRVDGELAQMVDNVAREVDAIVGRESNSKARDHQALADSMKSALGGADVILQDVVDGLESMRRTLEPGPRDKLLDGIERALLAQSDRIEELRVQANSISERVREPSAPDALAELDTSVAGLRHDVEKLTAEGEALRHEVVTRGEQLSANFGAGLFASPISMEAISARLSELRESNFDVASVEGADVVIEAASGREAVARTWHVIREVQTSAILSDSVRDGLLEKLYSLIGMEDVRQEFVLDVDRFDIGVSFRSQMVRLLLLKKRLSEHGYVIAPRLNDKRGDLEFARLLGIPVPATIQDLVRTEDLVPIPGSVIKPSVGESANGVFYVREDGLLLSLKSRKVYASMSEAVPEYEHLTDEGEALSWMMEEAVLGSDNLPARDLKVFMFYGRVGLFREILRGQGAKGGNLVATYDSQGEPTQYRESDDVFLGDGVPDGVVEMATKISEASPVPFLRVDFLVGSNGPVLGEITPHPGGIYAGDAFDDVDRRLGAMYLDSDARLIIDLLNGEKFDTYFEAYGVVAK